MNDAFLRLGVQRGLISIWTYFAVFGHQISGYHYPVFRLLQLGRDARGAHAFRLTMFGTVAHYRLRGQVIILLLAMTGEKNSAEYTFTKCADPAHYFLVRSEPRLY